MTPIRTLLKYRATLTQYMIETRRQHPEASGEFNELVLGVAQACKTIAREVSRGAAGGNHGRTGIVNVQGEEQAKLDIVANDAFIDTLEWTGVLAGMVSEEMDEMRPVPAEFRRGRYLLAFDPLDGSSNIDVDAPVGSIFSVRQAPDDDRPLEPADFLQPGARQVAAGYAIYGPSTMFVLTVGHGVAAFTLDRSVGDFVLTHPDVRIPEATSEFAINASNSRFWEPPVRRYVEECLAGRTGPRGKDFNMRWIASLVAEAHRILMRGGVFLYPRDTKDESVAGRLRLLYECDPIGMIVEQAGGRASTGEVPVLDVQPESLHQRIGFVFGSREEVELIERYHSEPRVEAEESCADTPLFNQRGLFRLPD